MRLWIRGQLVFFIFMSFIYISVKHEKISNFIWEIQNPEKANRTMHIRRFTDRELSALYQTQIESRINENYLQHYRGINRENVERLLPTDIKLQNASTIMSYERFFIMKDFQFWIQKHNITCNRFASVNGPDPEDRYIKCSESKIYFKYKEGADGRDNKSVDLYVLNLEQQNKIDFWSVQQTFEHIHNGHVVLRRLYDNSKCLGHLFVSVPIYNIPHMLPLHFYSYTPMGIVTMFFETGWKVIDLGIWGNREHLIEILKRKTWPTLFDALAEHERYNSSRDFFFNDPFFGFQVWLLGVKNCSVK